jgi:hypothetical protein
MNTNYKYVSPSTKLLLNDGTEKLASDLVVGDILLSSIPNEERIIKSISEHSSTNYLVISRYCNSPFMISEMHNLPVLIGNQVVLMNIKDFKKFEPKNIISLIHEPVELERIYVTLEPYILGIWLNNYDIIPSRVRFLKKNITIIMFVFDFVDKFNLEHFDTDDYIEITDKRLIAQFHNNDLFNNPTIPDRYKYNKKSLRSRLLAGFLDNNLTPEVEIQTKRLKDDFCYVVHSLGLLTQTRRKNSKWYVTIMQNVSIMNDFRVAKLEDDYKCLCLEITGMSPGILLPDFTMI